MAYHLSPSIHPSIAPLRFQSSERFSIRRQTTTIKPRSSVKHLLLFLPCRASGAQEASEESRAQEPSEEFSSTRSSTRTQLDLLEQLTSSTSAGSDYRSNDNLRRPTIREQLSELIGNREGDFSLPLGKRLKASMNTLTISQKRNIKRQDYMNEVERRNDSRFFATIGAFVILPPIAILAIAILTGYVQLLP